MTPERRAELLADVERQLEEAGRDYKVASDYGDLEKLPGIRANLRRLTKRRSRLKYPRPQRSSEAAA